VAPLRDEPVVQPVVEPVEPLRDKLTPVWARLDPGERVPWDRDRGRRLVISAGETNVHNVKFVHDINIPVIIHVTSDTFD
jgi:hypothetical protein